ncbi:hypothetical protein [Methylorubrum extorquens]|uniref:hypothetical protein n=1 Tax=Methylorubrum extorquens TaxID=408 RepID=UPI0011BFAD7E|nr:hypothetical protein [Methylorubrum extorquens]
MLATLIVSAAAHPAFAQPAQQPAQPPVPKTKIEAFTGTTGTVMIKGYTNVGSLSGSAGVEVQAMTFRNPNGNETHTGLAINVKEAGNSYGDSKRSFVDYDEIAGLLDGIKYVAKSQKGVTPLDFFESSYSTKDNLQVVVWNSRAGDVSANISAGSTYSRASAFVSLAQLEEFARLVEAGKKLLDGAR